MIDSGRPDVEKAFSIALDGGGESLVIPAVRQRLGTVFLAIWLSFVPFGVFAEFSRMRSVEQVPLLMAIGIVASTLIWFHVASVLLWMLTGREVLRVEAGYLEVTRRAFGLSRRWIYRGSSIAGLRVEPRPWLGTPKGGTFPFFANSRYGAVRFSYRGSKRDVALGLPENEARAVCDWLRKRLPQAQ